MTKQCFKDYMELILPRIEEPGLAVSAAMKGIIALRKSFLRHLSLPRPGSMAVRVLNDSRDPSTGLFTVNFWIAHPWYVKPTTQHRWGPKALFVRLFGNGAVPGQNDIYRESGYDLRTIGPTAQEKRGQDEMETIFSGLKEKNLAGGCPFHA